MKVGTNCKVKKQGIIREKSLNTCMHGFYNACSLDFSTQDDILADSDTEHLLDILSTPADVKIYDCQKTTINTEANLQPHQIRSLFQADQTTSMDPVSLLIRIRHF